VYLLKLCPVIPFELLLFKSIPIQAIMALFFGDFSGKVLGIEGQNYGFFIHYPFFLIVPLKGITSFSILSTSRSLKFFPLGVSLNVFPSSSFCNFPGLGQALSFSLLTFYHWVMG